MAQYGLRNYKMYWHTKSGGVNFGFKEAMPIRHWELIWRYLPALDPPRYSNACEANPVPHQLIQGS